MPVHQNQTTRGVHHITKDDLLFLLNKSDSDVLNDFNRTDFGFIPYLQYRKYKEKDELQIVEILIKLLNQVCSLRGVMILARLDRFLKMLKDCQVFLFDDIPRVINSCITKNPEINLVQFMSNYMNILSTLLRKDFFPCERIVSEIFPSLENYMNVLREKRFRKTESAEASFKQLSKRIEHYENPTLFDDDDEGIKTFRKLSVVPKNNDVINYEVTSVPKNIVDRPYKSVDHYLSVHYRLTREDMLRSFRECVNLCISSQGQETSILNKNRIFENVRVISPPIYTKSGICYKVKVQSAKEIDWAKKEILCPGSLIILTPNSFQSVIFATVKENPRVGISKSRECTLKIQLEDDCFEDKLKDDDVYSLIQPEAYFECYKHVLSAIKSFTEGTLPLSDMLVYLDFNDSNTAYSNKKMCLHEKCGSPAKHDETWNCKEFNPYNDQQWPTSEDLELDDQQYTAFKMAITKKVAVIQGPPGTGKTFIGKKLVKCLLENTPNKPIVICCLTNHALDQFLEGIISAEITDKVVRIGGQSKSEMLEPHMIQNIVYAVKQYKMENLLDKVQTKSIDLVKKIAKIVLDDKIIIDHPPEHYELLNLCDDLNSSVQSLTLITDKFLDDSALNDIIPSKYKEKLRNKAGDIKKSLTSSILEWLVCSRQSDLYDKCRKNFRSFNNTNVKLTQFKDVWDLTETKRYELFYIWRQKCIKILNKRIEDNEEFYKRLMRNKTYKPVDPIQLEIVKGSFIIGVTTTGACKYKDLIRLSSPEILVIEEAAQVLESHIIASLVPSIKHLILIGDHEQLRPLPANHELSEKYNLKISMFERLFCNQSPSATLVSQHRMKPCIAELLVPKPYVNYTSHEDVYKYEEIKGVTSSVFFFNHTEQEDSNSFGNSSSNKFEAKMIVTFAKYLYLQSYDLNKITILATYTSQVLLIYNYLKEANLIGIKVTTVDNFQGEENDIVLLSFVRSNPTTIGFLKESNRMCVALSRAKKGMFCFGNFDLYAKKNELWKDIVEKTRLKNMIGNSLELTCDQHKTIQSVQNAQDIIAFIGGGCSEKCNYVLSCGHTCVFTCHFKDPEHLYYNCKEPCERMMDETRVCPRLCNERCKRIKKKQVELPCGHFGIPDNPKCFQEFQRLLSCGHVVTVPCYLDIKLHKCEAIVKVDLKCGHSQSVCCHELVKPNKICVELTPETGPCGHVINVPCSLDLDETELYNSCNKACGTLLDCGHPCISLCRFCIASGIHGVCIERCELLLSCGHKCERDCNSPCPPCNKTCFLVCAHGTRCINACLRPCVKCNEPCDRKCSHTSCSKKCHEKCDAEPCMMSCEEILDCGHQCIGLCGDPCPYLCRVCNDEELSSEDTKDSLYVQLECGHVIEVGKLTVHLNDCVTSYEWPCCPDCNQIITQSTRFKEYLAESKEENLKSLDTSEVISEILYLVETMYGEDYIVPAEFQPIHNRIMQILKKGNPQSDTLYVLKQCILQQMKLVSVAKKLDEVCDSSLHTTFDTLLLWISYHLNRASFQQLKELEYAIKELCINVSHRYV